MLKAKKVSYFSKNSEFINAFLTKKQAYELAVKLKVRGVDKSTPKHRIINRLLNEGIPVDLFNIQYR